MSSRVNYAQYSAHFASIISDAIFYLLCSKLLCWHNWARPTHAFVIFIPSSVTTYLVKQCSVCLILNGIPLEQVDILGVLLSSDLSWSAYIDSIYTKARKLIGLLYRFYGNVAICTPIILFGYGAAAMQYPSTKLLDINAECV